MPVLRDVVWAIVVTLFALGIAVVATVMTGGLYAERSLLNSTVGSTPSVTGVPSPTVAGPAVRAVTLLVLAIALIAVVFLVYRILRYFTEKAQGIYS